MVAVPQTITIPSASDRQRIIDHAGKINKSTFTVGCFPGPLVYTHSSNFQALLWTFFALAISACIIRLYFRWETQRRLLYDDILILLATAFFIAETGILSWYTQRIYILEAGRGVPPLVPTLEQLDTLTWSTAWLNVYNSLG